MPKASPAYPATTYVLTAPPAPDAPPLNGDTRAAVAIIGGGYTGLSTALHLAEAGTDCLLLEAGPLARGASGRNGGQVNPGLKIEPGEAYEKFGRAAGGRLVRLAGEAPAYVFDLIRRHGIECEAARNGTIRVVRRESEAAMIAGTIADWAKEGVTLDRLEGTALQVGLGTANYPLGVLDRRGGSVNPLGYARGLAAAAARAGARLHGKSKVQRLTPSGNGAWLVETAAGRVLADRVVLATNGYSDDLWPGVRRSVVPFFSAIAATEPLPSPLRARILPGRQVAYESSWRVMYWRIDAQGRLLMGGPGVQRETADPAHYRHLVACALGLYPDLKNVCWTHHWCGQVAVSDDHLPHIHELAPGLLAALGYTGRGIALATVMGRELALRLGGAAPDELAFPVTPLQPIRFHRFWRPVASLTTWSAALRDRINGLV
ncbi:NAD(P)/FAD-dependent oxidoreductase [Dongia sp.]|uniref:NAD(P)/FAD-dependent oxidoreductase n=1 Tax=Dongia sp. TaxID=1977262 RepID=UPI0035AE7A8C